MKGWVLVTNVGDWEGRLEYCENCYLDHDKAIKARDDYNNTLKLIKEQQEKCMWCTIDYDKNITTPFCSKYHKVKNTHYDNILDKEYLSYLKRNEDIFSPIQNMNFCCDNYVEAPFIDEQLARLVEIQIIE